MAAGACALGTLNSSRKIGPVFPGEEGMMADLRVTTISGADTVLAQVTIAACTRCENEIVHEEHLTTTDC
jgi:hypothetical protein